jgi:hypothetical protein
MSEIIDRVAMALKAKAFAIVDQKQVSWQELARAAIEAMREPTAAMLRASSASSDAIARYDWEDMIDEALKE